MMTLNSSPLSALVNEPMYILPNEPETSRREYCLYTQGNLFVEKGKEIICKPSCIAFPMETKFPRTEKSFREYSISFNCCSAETKKSKCQKGKI